MYQECFKCNQNKAGEILLYTVKQGDTVYSIAQKYNSQVEWIQCMNQLNHQFIIYPNQQLYIPVLFNKQPISPYKQHSYDYYF